MPLSVMRDETADPQLRLDAAKAALPFCHPRLAPVAPKHSDPDFVPLVERLKEYLRSQIEAADRKVVELPRRQISLARQRRSAERVPVPTLRKLRAGTTSRVQT